MLGRFIGLERFLDEVIGGRRERLNAVVDWRVDPIFADPWSTMSSH